MHRQVQAVIKAESVQEGMRNLLPTLQLRASRHFWEPRCVSLLRQHDYPWWQTQVPLETRTRRSNDVVVVPSAMHSGVASIESRSISCAGPSSGMCCCCCYWIKFHEITMRQGYRRGYQRKRRIPRPVRVSNLKDYRYYETIS